MRIVRPRDVDSGVVSATNVINEYDDWSAGDAPYAEGDRVVFGEYAWEALSNTSEQPDEGAQLDPPEWVRLGHSNEWRMFRDGTDSRSSQVEKIEVTLEFPQTVNVIAVLGATGASARVVATIDSETVYDETRTLTDIGVDDWWPYFFSDYEVMSKAIFSDTGGLAGAAITVTVAATSATSDAECGRLIAGLAADVGVTLEGVQSRLEQFARKQRDEFGNLTLTPRRTIRIVDYDFVVEPSLVDQVERRFQQISAVPVLFIGHDELPETVVFGVFEEFSTIINGHTITECSATVEEF